jgi:hypothetical protein
LKGKRKTRRSLNLEINLKELLNVFIIVNLDEEVGSNKIKQRTSQGSVWQIILINNETKNVV